jgi:hypothetical protein
VEEEIIGYIWVYCYVYLVVRITLLRFNFLFSVKLRDVNIYYMQAMKMVPKMLHRHSFSLQTTDDLFGAINGSVSIAYTPT